MNSELVDVFQTVAILLNGAVLIYIVWRLEKAFETAAGKLGFVITHQADIQASIERAWKRLDEVEARQGVRQDQGELQAALKTIADRLEALEKRLPPENQFPISWAAKNNR